jgi:hypothetical protein
MRKGLFVATGGLSGAAGIKANSKKERIAKATEKQLKLQQRQLKIQQQQMMRASTQPPAAPADTRASNPVLDPWLNEIAVALADQGLKEAARNVDPYLGGAPTEAQISLTGHQFAAWVTVFPSDSLARQAESELRANAEIQSAIGRGFMQIRTKGRVEYLANGQGHRLDPSRLDAVVTAVSKVELPPLLSDTSNGEHGADGPLEQLRKLGELRDAGVVTAEEFEAKKAELLGRV